MQLNCRTTNLMLLTFGLRGTHILLQEIIQRLHIFTANQSDNGNRLVRLITISKNVIFYIFQNSFYQESVPYIPNHYILHNIIKCETYKYDYNETELCYCLDKDNDGALDSRHFFVANKIFSRRLCFPGVNELN